MGIQCKEHSVATHIALLVKRLLILSTSVLYFVENFECSGLETKKKKLHLCNTNTLYLNSGPCKCTLVHADNGNGRCLIILHLLIAVAIPNFAKLQ